MKNIVLNINALGADSVLGAIAKFWNYKIPENTFGWKNKSNYTHYIIVNEDELEQARKQCEEIKLNSFIILSRKGMIIGG